MTGKMRREKVFVALLLILGCLSTRTFAQNMQKSGWDRLTDVSFEPKYLEEYGESFLVPSFGPKTSEMDGKSFEITGYLIPIDPEQDIYILSAFPFASCFFCGNAGPETIMELVFKRKSKNRQKTYQIDDIRSFKGVLKLNATDINHTNFILEKAEELK